MDELAKAVREYTQFLAACKLLEYGYSRDPSIIKPTIETLKQIAKAKDKP